MLRIVALTVAVHILCDCLTYLLVCFVVGEITAIHFNLRERGGKHCRGGQLS
jgi:hypothetical protein